MPAVPLRMAGRRRLSGENDFTEPLWELSPLLTARAAGRSPGEPCQGCLHPHTPMQAVFANAEVMLLHQGPARDDNVALGGSAQRPKSLKVCFGVWGTVGLWMALEEVTGGHWLFGCGMAVTEPHPLGGDFPIYTHSDALQLY